MHLLCFPLVLGGRLLHTKLAVLLVGSNPMYPCFSGVISYCPALWLLCASESTFPSPTCTAPLLTLAKSSLCSGFCAPYPERGLWFTYYKHILTDDFGKWNRHHCRIQKSSVREQVGKLGNTNLQMSPKRTQWQRKKVCVCFQSEG